MKIFKCCTADYRNNRYNNNTTLVRTRDIIIVPIASSKAFAEETIAIISI